MSVKFLVFVALVGGSGYLLTRNAPPIPPGTTATDSAALAQAGIGARFHYGMGHFGTKLVGGTVRNMVEETEQALKDMQPAIKKSRGSDGTRARKNAAKIMGMDSVAIYSLEYGHPVEAVRQSMEAKSLLNSVRMNLQLND
jgi:hypothetical protein